MKKSKLISWCKDRGWRQKDLAELCGVDQSQVSRWMSGSAPIPKYLKKLMSCKDREMICKHCEKPIEKIADIGYMNEEKEFFCLKCFISEDIDIMLRID